MDRLVIIVTGSRFNAIAIESLRLVFSIGAMQLINKDFHKKAYRICRAGEFRSRVFWHLGTEPEPLKKQEPELEPPERNVRIKGC